MRTRGKGPAPALADGYQRTSRCNFHTSGPVRVCSNTARAVSQLLLRDTSHCLARLVVAPGCDVAGMWPQPDRCRRSRAYDQAQRERCITIHPPLLSRHYRDSSAMNPTRHTDSTPERQAATPRRFDQDGQAGALPGLRGMVRRQQRGRGCPHLSTDRVYITPIIRTFGESPWWLIGSCPCMSVVAAKTWSATATFDSFRRITTGAPRSRPVVGAAQLDHPRTGRHHACFHPAVSRAARRPLLEAQTVTIGSHVECPPCYPCQD